MDQVFITEAPIDHAKNGVYFQKVYDNSAIQVNILWIHTYRGIEKINQELFDKRYTYRS